MRRRAGIGIVCLLAATAAVGETPTSTSTPTQTSTPTPNPNPTATPPPLPGPLPREAGERGDPQGEPTLATPPQLKDLVPAEVPPGTVFPSPEVAVVLAIDVSAEGAVEDVRVEQGAGEPFDSAALAAARRFAFAPGRLSTGEPVPVTITFRLRIAAPPPPAEAAPPPRPVKLAGRLLERGTRRPIASAAVAARSDEGETYARATTDGEGRFALEVPVPRFAVVAAAAGHERLQAYVDAQPGEEREETFYLESTVGGENVSIVRGERVRREITKQVIPADEVATVAGTQGDTLKAVLNLPGAARASFGGGELVLRGSSPEDSAAFIEGLEVPIAYHFGGLRSTFAPRFLESLEFVPGNFSPDYGRLTGGIVNVRARDPAADAIHGEADLNVYDAGVAIEGPLSDAWSGGFAFRRSWVDAVLPLVLPEDSNLSFTSAPRFYDYQLIATWKPDERDRVRVLYFGSQDKLVAIFERPAGEDPSLSGDLAFRIAYHVLQASWTRVFSPSFRQETWIAAGMQEIDTEIGPRLFFDLATRRLDLRSTWSWQARPRLEVRAGVDVQRAWYDISLDVPRVPKEGEPPAPISSDADTISASETGTFYAPAAFAEVRLTPRDGLDVMPSLRVDWNSTIRRWSADPRLQVRWRVAPRTVLKGAAGVYQQPPAPDESGRFSGNPDLLPKRTLQYSAGIEQQVRDGVELETTAFYKDLSRNVVRNLANEVDPNQPVFLNTGEGRIYGLEALLRARFGERFFGWIAYTYQRSFRTDRPGEEERRFDFDQPHILTAVASWRPTISWAFGARFRLVSGNPYTPISDAIYDAGGDVWVPVYGATNSARLAPFHALDLRADRTWTFDRWRLSAYLDVQNVYNRGNPEGWSYRFDYRQRERLTGLPILPIVGLKGEW